MGTPNEDTMPGISANENFTKIKFEMFKKQDFRDFIRSELISDAGLDLLQKLLEYDPTKRISARQALLHPYFSENWLINQLVKLDTLCVVKLPSESEASLSRYSIVPRCYSSSRSSELLAFLPRPRKYNTPKTTRAINTTPAMLIPSQAPHVRIG